MQWSQASRATRSQLDFFDGQCDTDRNTDALYSPVVWNLSYCSTGYLIVVGFDANAVYPVLPFTI